MLLIRPIKESDLDDLMELISISGFGLSSLPKDREIMERKIKASVQSFTHESPVPSGEVYYFALEDLFTGKMVGISGIISKIGGFEPYYFYRIHEQEHTSKMLNKTRTVKSLHVEKTHSGPAEVCSLFLHPEYRSSQNGRFLSLSRFLFMAEKPHLFEETVIAEMRGQVNDEGHSPFWDAVGKKFMDIEFVDADYLGLKSKQFIDDLLPKFPIPIDLLPEAAQKVIGEVHRHTEPAKKILTSEGFYFAGLVGIFEPGPILEAHLPDIRAIKESIVCSVTDISTEKLEGEDYLIATSDSPKFKATLGKVKVDGDSVTIEAVVATSLKLKVGQKLRFIPLRPH